MFTPSVSVSIHISCKNLCDPVVHTEHQVKPVSNCLFVCLHTKPFFRKMTMAQADADFQLKCKIIDKLRIEADSLQQRPSQVSNYILK